jgi:predicted NBD/HSP70 family sugar kinase
VTARPFDAGTLAASAVLRILADGRPRTRVELAEMLGLARATVALRVEPLIGAGLVGSVLDAPSTGGRPPSRLTLRAGSRLVLAADVGATRARVALTDLGGRILASRSRAIAITGGPEPLLAWVLETAVALATELDRMVGDIAAVGVGLPGPVDHGSGRPAQPPQMPGWDGYDVPARLQRRLVVPVLVDNDVNIMALGERAVGWPGVDDFVFVKVATGIGAGIVSGGILHRGAQSIAGHIGHLPVARAAGVACACGNTGCVTAVASGSALAAQLRGAGVDAADSADVADLVLAGDERAIAAVRQAGRDLGEVLVACTGFVNPAVIAVGGSLARSGEPLLEGIREVVLARAMPLAAQSLVIAASRTGSDAGVIGAALMAVDYLIAPAGVTALVGR